MIIKLSSMNIYLRYVLRRRCNWTLSLYCKGLCVKLNNKIAIINNFIYSNFNYCPLVWYFCSCLSSEKIESIRKRWFRLVLNDYAIFLRKKNATTMEMKWLRTLDQSLIVLGPKIWNRFPSDVKSLTPITKFKEYTITWFGPS